MIENSRRTMSEKINTMGSMEKRPIESVITLKELYASIVEIRTEVKLIRRVNRETVWRFNLWAFLVVVLELLNLYAHLFR